MAEQRAGQTVIIVGAGIIGSSLALALSHSGLDITLVEARPLAPPSLPAGTSVADFDSRVSALTPRSVALLERLGAWQAIEDYRCCPYARMTVWDADGTGAVNFDRDEVDAPALGTIVENRAITAALLHTLSNSSGVRLRDGAAVAALSRDDDGVHLELDDGDVLHGNLVVAADGALSRLREMAGFRTREWDYGHQALVATVETAAGHEQTAWQRFLPTGPLALLPLPGAGDRFCSIVWSVTEPRAQELLALDDAAFRAALGRDSEYRLGEIVDCSARIAFPLRQRHAVDYVAAGIALVGDAAHTIHPLAGQGVNLGLQDVAVLAEELADGAAGGVNPGQLALLRRYQRRRKGDNLLMMAAMDGFKRLFEQEALPVRWLRNTGMRSVDRLQPLKRQLMRHAMGLG